MQTFKDTQTNQYWQFDDEDDVRLIDGIYTVFDALGNRMHNVPETLEPAELPEPKALTTEELREQVLALRQAAYKAESDPLYMVWQFDATEAKRLLWINKVQEIKARYPLPV